MSFALANLSAESDSAYLSQVWSAETLAQSGGTTHPSGFALLDAELPGGGWPQGAMSEILHEGPESFAWPLLMPALARAVDRRCKPVALVGAPHAPFGPALAGQGLPPEALLWVRCEAPAARLWACEQALRCADMAAVLAWLPQARVAELRRLQLAAAQHDQLLWVFRPLAQAGQASPARLRLRVAAAADGCLDLQLLKRRGPPMAQPVNVAALPARLAAVLAAGARRRAPRQAVPASGAMAPALQTVWQASTGLTAALTGIASPLPPVPAAAAAPAAASATVIRLGPFDARESAHALDRPAVAA